MAGLVPAIHELRQPIVQIVPVRVRREDQANLSLARPVFHVVLAQDCRGDIGMALDVDQPLQTISLGETGYGTLTVLANASRKFARDADVENAAGLIRDNVYPGIAQSLLVEHRRVGGNAAVDGRDKPGHDVFFWP